MMPIARLLIGFAGSWAVATAIAVSAGAMQAHAVGSAGDRMVVADAVVAVAFFAAVIAFVVVAARSSVGVGWRIGLAVVHMALCGASAVGLGFFNLLAFDH